MPAPANYEKVQLTPLPTGEWRIASAWGNGKGNGHYPHFKLDKDSGPHIINFEIVGGQPNVTFKDLPIAVKAGSKPQPGNSNPQIAWAPGATPTKTVGGGHEHQPGDRRQSRLNYVLYVNNFKDPRSDHRQWRHHQAAAPATTPTAPGSRPHGWDPVRHLLRGD